LIFKEEGASILWRLLVKKLMIRIENLTKKFDRKVLDNITISLPKNRVSVIVGINGSGKTTLLDCIVGLKDATSGKVFIESYSNDSEKFKECIFYIPSEFYLPNYMTGKEYLNFVLSRYRCSDIERIDDFLELFDLKFAGTNLIESYSFGMKKKIQIVAAALANTDYILGDEIFNGLDFETTLLTLELFENLSREVGIVIISHNKLIIERFSENILLMSNGNLTPFLGSSENLEKEVISTEKIHEKIKYIKGYHPINRVIY